jgi:hypothetical protein
MKFLELVIIFISKSCGVNSAVFVTSSDLFDVFLGFKFMFSSSSGLDFQWKSRPIIKRSTLPASWSTRTMRKFVGPNVIHEIIMVRLGKIKRIHIHIHSSKFTISHLNLAMLDPWAVDHVDPESPLWLRKKGRVNWGSPRPQPGRADHSANFVGSATTSHGRGITNWNEGNWTPQLKLRAQGTNMVQQKPTNTFWKVLEDHLKTVRQAHVSWLFMTYDILWLISVPLVREQNEMWTRI